MEGETFTLRLNGGHVALLDAADRARVLAHRWTAGVIAGRVYVHRIDVGDRLYLHRFLLPHARRVYFVNGNPLDLRRANLTTQNPAAHRPLRRPAPPPPAAAPATAAAP